MKKIISLLLTIALIAGLNGMTFASDEIKLKSPMSTEYCSIVYSQISFSRHEDLSVADKTLKVMKGNYLFSFNEEPIAIFYELFPQGYAIIDYNNKVLLEYSTENNNQYFVEPEEKYYYNGVLGYFKKIATDKFLNLITGTVVSGERCFLTSPDDFYGDQGVPAINNYASVIEEGYLIHETRPYNCNVTANFSYFFPNFTSDQLASIPGVCGSLACSVVMAYFDDYKSSLAGYGDFATNWKKNSGLSSNSTYGIELVKEMISHVEPNRQGSVMLDSPITSYLSAHNIYGGSSADFIFRYEHTRNTIMANGSGSPVIIGTSDHYCVAEGYKNDSSKKIYVNYGNGGHCWILANATVSAWAVVIY